jgi:hypothetical protein
MTAPTRAELNKALAVLLRAAVWALDDASRDIAAGRFTADQYAELAEQLEALTIAVRVRAEHG